MGTSDPPHAWRGRWILAGVLLAVTAAAVLLAARAAPRAYQSQGSVVLLASRAAARPNGGNPYLSFSPSLTIMADVLSRELMAPGTAAWLEGHGLTEPFTAAPEPSTTATSGSVMVIEVTGRDPGLVQATLHGVLGQLRSKLAGLQSGLPAASRIRPLTLVLPSRPTVNLGQTARPLAVLAALGLALSFGLPWLVDAQVTARRERRAARQATGWRAEQGWPRDTPGWAQDTEHGQAPGVPAQSAGARSASADPTVSFPAGLLRGGPEEGPPYPPPGGRHGQMPHPQSAGGWDGPPERGFP